MSLRTYLEGLDARSLTTLLRQRADVLAEPAPRTLDELAERLDSAGSLSRALVLMDRDELSVARAIALLEAISVPSLAQVLHSTETVVGEAADRLCARGLAFPAGGKLELTDRLDLHFAERLLRFSTLAAIVKDARAADLAPAIAGLGGDATTGTRARLGERLAALLADPEVVVQAVRGLPPFAARYLDTLLRADEYFYISSSDAAEREMVAAGLMIRGGKWGRPELPREVAVALLLQALDPLVGRPELPSSTAASDDGRAAAEAAVRAVTALLDEADVAPLAELKKGGIGAREQKRLATRLGVPDMALWIDIAAAMGLLVVTPSGYVPAGNFDQWRDAPAALRWAQVALAWFALEAAPTSRETDDGDVPPPLPMESSAGMVRRALLRSAAGGRSVHEAEVHVDWFCPLHPYDEAGLARKLAAAEHEASALGVLAGDRLTVLGELLVELAEGTAADLATRAADLLPPTRGMVVLQSDFTALVSGQASTAAVRLLAASAAPEGKGVAATWRFTPASVRAALDAGWTADELRVELAAISGRDVPQPLDYLIGDVARRHGSVRVRGTRVCVVGTEAEITEILHTRSLAKLQLARLAPTVLTSPLDVDDVLVKLRAAGFSPMPEDADGAVIVMQRAKPAAPARRGRSARASVDAAELATRLTSATHLPPPPSATRR